MPKYRLTSPPNQPQERRALRFAGGVLVFERGQAIDTPFELSDAEVGSARGKGFTVDLLEVAAPPATTNNPSKGKRTAEPAASKEE